MPQKPRGSLPYFKFYAADWLSSVTISGVPVSCEGGYIRLLAYCWSDRNCSLPDDDKQLLDMARISPDHHDVLPFKQLLAFAFVKHPEIDNRRTNLKLYEQHLALVSVSKKRAQAGAKGGAVKGKSNGKQKLSKRVSKTEAKRKQTASASPSFKSKKKGTRAGARELVLGDLPESARTDEWLDALNDWLAYKAERGESYKPRGLKAFVTAATSVPLVDFKAKSLRAQASNWAGWDFGDGKANRPDPKSAAAIAANLEKYQ